MITLDKSSLRDKIHACWVGKNIGGTMGTPYEGKRDLNDIKGFSTDPGVVLPNDDLDLQLVWLKAVEELGPQGINEKVLGEYWLSYIGPHWNEYGIGKSNMREGFLPPLSGEMCNEEWKHSNGAWIRTEIWACLFPGNPERAIRYAFYDAAVDHGFNEGTYAAIFVEAMESAAFVFNDINVLLDIGLSKIPEDCRVAAAVRLVRSEHAKGTDWQTVREMLIKQSEDIGWFQAPANVAYVVLGLLYGGCDFKKSMILALNCGDDTDCTGATTGSLLGLMYGMKAIPEDWSAHIGDSIVTLCNLKGHGNYPESCTELTDCVMGLLPATTYVPFFTNPHVRRETTTAVIGDADDFSSVAPGDFMGSGFIDRMLARSKYSFYQDNVFARVWVEFDEPPEIAPNGTLSGRVSVSLLRMPEQKHFRLRWVLPFGWTVAGKSNLFASAEQSEFTERASAPFLITAPDYVDAINSIILEVTSVGRPTPIYLPIVVLG